MVVGGGVQGLAAAWGLAEGGADVLVLEKERIGAGASGVAGGIVRNFYRSAGITELVRLSVELFEAEPEAYGFRQVGYLAAVPAAQVDDLAETRRNHERAAYDSELVVGADECREYLRWAWPDWEAPVEALLHERRGGWADAMKTVRRLAERARGSGAEIAEGVEVTGFDLGDGGIDAIRTSEGTIRCESVLLAPGPWAARLWEMLGRDPDVQLGGGRRQPLFSYLKAQEGEFTLPGVGLAGAAGTEPPVVHLDQPGPLASDRDGRLLVDGPWGVYFRMGRTGTGITGGGLPVELERPAMDPYGPGNPDHAAGDDFGEFFTSGLAAAVSRFRGRAGDWRWTLGGGIVMHTPDNYPVCDWVAANAYAIIDSGHCFKMLALGRLAAADMLSGEPRLEPFRLSRFERGATHVASMSPYPWT